MRFWPQIWWYITHVSLFYSFLIAILWINVAVLFFSHFYISSSIYWHLLATWPNSRSTVAKNTIRLKVTFNIHIHRLRQKSVYPDEKCIFSEAGWCIVVKHCLRNLVLIVLMSLFSTLDVYELVTSEWCLTTVSRTVLPSVLWFIGIDRTWSTTANCQRSVSITSLSLITSLTYLVAED